MEYRPLGHTGLNVSEIGFGCASFWGKTLFNDAEAIALVHAAAEGGVTFFDTGSSYSGGNAEPRLGQALSTLANRHELVVATKAGTRLRGNKLYKDFSPASVRSSVEASLARLRLDTIPLLQLHGPQISDLTDDLLSTLVQMKQEGKIRHLGVNSFDMPVIDHVSTLPPFEVVMIDYNILRPERAGIIRKLAERKIGILAGMALAGGLYTPKHLGFSSLRDLWYTARVWKNHRADIARGKHFRFITHEKGWTGGEVALAWVLKNPAVSCAIIGTTRTAHLQENIQASGKALTPDILTRIEQVHASWDKTS